MWNFGKGEKVENLESKMQELAGKSVQEVMLEAKNKINYSFLREIAPNLSDELSEDEFIKAFSPNAKGRANIKTPIKDVEIDVAQAYKHLYTNENGEDRRKISGGVLLTLQKPFFVSRSAGGSYYFYKPFKDEKGVLNLVSIEVPKSNRLKYKTSYIGDKNRMLALINKYELVYKSW